MRTALLTIPVTATYDGTEGRRGRSRSRSCSRSSTGEIVILGSPQPARTLIEHDLLDELRLMGYRDRP